MRENTARSRNSETPPAQTAFSIVSRALAGIGRFFVTLLMVGIITGCIVACTLTVYILQLIGADTQVNLDSVRLGYTSIIYATDYETGETFELQRLYRPNSNRIWTDYDDISESVKKAIVAVEDKRFWQHNGVDWRRTAGAFVGMLAPQLVGNTTSGGGSTITQQLIKNITGDDEVRADRKVREIFRALDLSQRYTREQILETYLNVVSFGSGTNGIQSAANTYFGKDAKDLTLAESAAIVGITQKPTAYNPFLYPERNKERQEDVLFFMLEQNLITQEEYEQALAEKLDFKREAHQEAISHTQSYFVDHVINEVIADLMDAKQMTKSRATTELYEGGYKIYVTMDKRIQEHLENIYLNTDAFPKIHNEEYPQSACVITDPNGKILGLVGGIGPKEGALVFNRATMATRQPGSALKPLGPYALSFEYDYIRWSTIIDDYPINIAKAGEPEKLWPRNYYGTFLRNVTIDRAVQKSINTVPAKLVQVLKPRTVFDFLHDKLNFYSLVERQVIDGRVLSDIELSPMTLGSLTHGVTPLEMVGGYQMFVNGGTFTTPYAYTEVRDSNDRVVLKPDTTARRVISEDTATVLNKLLQRVTNGPEGTGTAARLPNMPTGGKTGTSDDDVNQWFIGFTPYYVCGVWLGYDEELKVVTDANGRRYTAPNTILYNGLGYPPPKLWKTIMEPLTQGQEYKAFEESPEVVSLSYCLITGDLAGPDCDQVATGWYKKSNLPSTCTGLHHRPGDEEAEEEGDAPEDAPVDARQQEADAPLMHQEEND